MSELTHVDLCRVSAGELLLATIALGFAHCWPSPSRREHGYKVWHLSWALLVLLLGKAWTPQVPLGPPGLTTAPNVPADLPPIFQPLRTGTVKDVAHSQLFPT